MDFDFKKYICSIVSCQPSCIISFVRWLLPGALSFFIFFNMFSTSSVEKGSKLSSSFDGSLLMLSWPGMT